MAKLGLILIAVFLFVQIALARRVVRDAPTTTGDDTKNAFEQGFDTLKKGFEDTFNKENWDTFVSKVSGVGDELTKIGKDIVTKVQESTKSS